MATIGLGSMVVQLDLDGADFIRNTGQARQALGTIHEKVRAFGSGPGGLSEATRLTRNLAGSIASEVNPALGAMINSMTVTARTTSHFGISLSTALVGLTATTTALAIFISSSNEAAKRQAALNAAIQVMDFGGVSGQLHQVIRDLDALDNSLQGAILTLTRTPGAFNVLDKLFGRDVMKQAAEDARAAEEELGRSIELPKIMADATVKTEQARMALLDFQQAQLALGPQTAAIRQEMETLWAHEMDSLERATAAQRVLVDLEELRAKTAAAAIGSGIEWVIAATKAANDRLAIEQAFDKQAAVLVAGRVQKTKASYLEETQALLEQLKIRQAAEQALRASTAAALGRQPQQPTFGWAPGEAVTSRDVFGLPLSTVQGWEQIQTGFKSAGLLAGLEQLRQLKADMATFAVSLAKAGEEGARWIDVQDEIFSTEAGLLERTRALKQEYADQPGVLNALNEAMRKVEFGGFRVLVDEATKALAAMGQETSVEAMLARLAEILTTGIPAGVNAADPELQKLSVTVAGLRAQLDAANGSAAALAYTLAGTQAQAAAGTGTGGIQVFEEP